MTDAELVAEARTAALGAYAPYSGFRVGAVVVAEDGRTFTGANVENAAYPSGLCAEAVAIGTAVASGVRRIATIAVACIDADDLEGAYPCGQCRQRMNEFATERVLVATASGAHREHRFAELLPHGFRLRDEDRP